MKYDEHAKSIRKHEMRCSNMFRLLFEGALDTVLCFTSSLLTRQHFLHSTADSRNLQANREASSLDSNVPKFYKWRGFVNSAVGISFGFSCCSSCSLRDPSSSREYSAFSGVESDKGENWSSEIARTKSIKLGSSSD